MISIEVSSSNEISSVDVPSLYVHGRNVMCMMSMVVTVVNRKVVEAR